MLSSTRRLDLIRPVFSVRQIFSFFWDNNVCWLNSMIFSIVGNYQAGMAQIRQKIISKPVEKAFNVKITVVVTIMTYFLLW